MRHGKTIGVRLECFEQFTKVFKYFRLFPVVELESSALNAQSDGKNN